jgi:serine/threonine protein kinase
MPAIPGQTLPPGERVGGFEILQVIGLTSFGVLYLGRHLEDGSTAAIKEYMPSSLAFRGREGAVEINDPMNEPAFQRGLHVFLTEALTLSQFEHPNLLRVHLVWEENGTAYRAMPHLGGSTLLAWRSTMSEPASQLQLQTLLDGLLAALFALNQAGLAHGQVEPLNIYLEGNGRPVLMDFDAVHQALQSDPSRPYVDAYADPTRMQALSTDDLHAVAAVLHFAISGDWRTPRAGQRVAYPPLSDVLLRFKDSASALQYQPDFLAAIDTALSLPTSEQPGTITEFRALFEPRPLVSPAEPVEEADSGPTPLAPDGPPATHARRTKREPIPTPPPVYPLNSSESVLALLANFDRGPAPAAEDVEPFEAPQLPTLTEEAEPALPPLRIVNPFDDLEDRDALPVLSAQEPSDFEPLPYTAMPSARRRAASRTRLLVIAGMAVAFIAAIGTLGWQILSPGGL